MSQVAERNVVLQDYHGNTLAGFWQYGTTSWNKFLTLLHTLVDATDSWAIFDFDAGSPNRHGEERSASDVIVSKGVYILLRKDGSPIDVHLTEASARRRQPTHATRAHPSTQRTQNRDRKCLITGQQLSRTRLAVAHIFSRIHRVEWSNKEYRTLITDPAPTLALGGLSKIDSIQNMISLRSDLQHGWDNYEFAVDADDDYKVTAFVSNYDDVHGLSLQLDHIADLSLRPLDELFQDHFMQGVLKHIKGAGDIEG